MHVFQTLLLIAGTTSIGLAVGCYGTLLLALALSPSQRESEHINISICVLVVPIGFGLLGAIVGFARGIRHAPRYANETWGSITWLGVFRGLITWWGYGAFTLTAWWPARIVVTIATGTVVGFAANRAEARWQDRNPKR